jgi:hypothetical protein
MQYRGRTALQRRVKLENQSGLQPGSIRYWCYSPPSREGCATMRFLLAMFALFAVCSCQPRNAAVADSPPAAKSANRFVGVWKLNKDKSISMRKYDEMLTTEPAGSNFKFTFDNSETGKGNVPHWWFVTDLNGSRSEIHPAPNSPLPAEREGITVTRKTPDTLLLQGSICQTEYKISADAQSMTAHVECNVDYDPRRVLVYDRLR